MFCASRCVVAEAQTIATRAFLITRESAKGPRPWQGTIEKGVHLVPEQGGPMTPKLNNPPSCCLLTICPEGHCSFQPSPPLTSLCPPPCAMPQPEDVLRHSCPPLPNAHPGPPVPPGKALFHVGPGSASHNRHHFHQIICGFPAPAPALLTSVPLLPRIPFFTSHSSAQIPPRHLFPQEAFPDPLPTLQTGTGTTPSPGARGNSEHSSILYCPAGVAGSAL